MSGPIIVGIRPLLPVPGVSLLLGNDIAGGKVLPSPHMSEKPDTDQNTEILADTFPGIFPDCIVTRSMEKRNLNEIPDEINLSDTFMGMSTLKPDTYTFSPMSQHGKHCKHSDEENINSSWTAVTH